MKIFYILSVLAIAQGCRVIQDRPSGGKAVARIDHSSVVLIETFINYERKYYCAGVLISSNFALTTARCVIGAIFANIHVNAFKFYDIHEEKREIHRATEIIYKEPFDRYPSHNDIALVKLPITLNLTAKEYTVAKLPTAPLAYNSTGKSVGWGLIDFYDEDEFATNVKYEVDLRYVPLSDCELAYPRLNWTTFGEGGRGCVVKTTGVDCVSGKILNLKVNR